MITLEHIACFGACPVYTVDIFEDGTVIYDGNKFINVTGKQTSGIAPETVSAMVQAFKDTDYFGWDKAYDNQTIIDLPSVIASVADEGKTHRHCVLHR